MIIRAPKNNYVSTTRSAPQDRRLSWAARGVLWYLLSKPDDWEVQPKDLEQQCGRDKVYSILNELKKFGYLELVEIRDENGKFKDHEYHVNETPLTDLPEAASPDAAKPDITYKRTLDKQDSTKKTMAAPLSPTFEVPKLSKKKKPSKPRKPSPHAEHYNALVSAFVPSGVKVPKTEDSGYWKVAHELYDCDFPVAKIPTYYNWMDSQDWNGFTVHAMSNHVSDFLKWEAEKPNSSERHTEKEVKPLTKASAEDKAKILADLKAKNGH